MPIQKSIIDQEVQLIGKQLEARKLDIAKRLLKPGADNAEALRLHTELVQLCADTILIGIEETMPNVTKWGRETGELAVSYGSELDESLKTTSEFRQAIWDVIELITVEANHTVQSVFRAGKLVDRMLDHAVYAYSTAYVTSYKNNLSHAQEVFLELSVPVVPILEGVAVLPIIGDVDTHRASLLMETALRESTEKHLTHLFIDLSGVTIVDTMVANNIFNIIYSLELLGVKGILSGIRPEVAQTMIHLGIDFSSIQTHSTLKQALARHIL
ncbi:STAS domain-containing protein [Bacillus sp. es.036]|uniref:STAS domain-containing protein n=1 Tax=Bacillus sp. es.036 TaxID=1761764 RepID=UPI000BF6EB87|nr:STAS domain-containing protein [Bacillus sp. es.036]PFG11934.1 rsbT co-antagonist protein RsbR [Bacillus sp. es.036]